MSHDALRPSDPDFVPNPRPRSRRPAAEGVRLATWLARCFGAEVAGWVHGLEQLLPGRFHLLPGRTADRCDALYVPPGDEDGEPVVMTVAIAADGTFDVEVVCPSFDRYVADRRGERRFDPSHDPDDRAALEAAITRIFGRRRTLFGMEPC